MLLVGRLVLVAVFAVSGVAKLLNFAGTATTLRRFRVPQVLVGPGAVLLPIVELAAAGLLLPRSTEVIGAALGGALLLTFSVVIAMALARGDAPDCHCFGQVHAGPTTWRTLARDVALASVAAFVAIAGAGDPGASLTAWIDDLGGGVIAASAVAVLLGVSLGFQVWFSLGLLRQHGRLLNRLDELEARMTWSGPPSASTEGLGQSEAAPNGVYLRIRTGTPAAEFALPDAHGRVVSLRNLLSRGLPVVLVFADSGCGPCRILLPQLAEWQRGLADSLAVAIVSSGTPAADRAAFDDHGITDVLFQTDREVAERYGVHGTPSAVLITPEGRTDGIPAEGANAISKLIAGHTDRRPPTAVPGPSPRRMLAIGQPAPESQLTNASGHQMSLAALRGREVVLLFWNPNCEFCRRMTDDIQAWERQRGQHDPDLVVVSATQPPGHTDANSLASDDHDQAGFSSLLAFDPSQRTAQAFGASGTPSAIRLDSHGRIASALVLGGESVMTLLQRDDAGKVSQPLHLIDLDGGQRAAAPRT